METSSFSESLDGEDRLPQRLALLYAFASVSILLAMGLSAVASSVGADMPGGKAFQSGIAAAGGFFTLAALCWRARSKRLLTVLDVAGNLCVGGVLLLMIASFQAPERVVHGTVQAVTYLVVGRSILVPSSASRTLLIGGVLTCAAILCLVHTHEPDWATTASLLPDAGQLLASLGLAALCSRTIYGLQREIEEARRMGQYVLEDRIGEGGMGVVYAARHALLQRRTAIKVLRRESLSEANLVRFEREVRLTASLSHPSTIAIYDFGRSERGEFFYAMELLDGVDLENLIRYSGPLPPERVVHILRQLCGALAEAHGAGLVHRDIKPANVLICRRSGDADICKLVDFGLVKQVDTRELGITAVDMVVGTPAYLAPEAITAPDRVDFRADLYALGALAYFLLTGRTVFDGVSVVEVCAKHLHYTPAPPSQHVANIPGPLERTVLACLEKDPNMRPFDADVLDTMLGDSVTAQWDRAKQRLWWATHGEALLRQSRSPHAPVTHDKSFVPARAPRLGRSTRG